MFPLHTKSFPSSAADLARLMNESLQRIFITDADPVRLEEASYPQLRSLRLVLDRARLRPGPPLPPAVDGGRAPALHLHELRIEGSQLTIGPVIADLRLSARDVRLDQARDAVDEIVLLVKSAAEGEVEIATSKSDLDAAITAVASREAGKHGVTIEDVNLILHERGPRSVSAEVKIKARKLFFSTTIGLTADLALDDELNATISGLACRGDGVIGALVCGALAPHLEKLNGRTFSLLALPLGEIRLRDVRLSTAGEKVAAYAEFG